MNDDRPGLLPLLWSHGVRVYLAMFDAMLALNGLSMTCLVFGATTNHMQFHWNDFR